MHIVQEAVPLINSSALSERGMKRHLKGLGRLIVTVNDSSSESNEMTHLNMEDVYATSGTISRPFSSMPLSIEYTDKMHAMENQIVS